LHNIGLGIAVYRENKGKYPPDLKTLLDEGYIDDAQTFVSPLDMDPPTLNGLKTSYVYIGTPVPQRPDPRIPFVYTRRGLNRRNVLYADHAVGTLHGRGFGRISAQEAYESVVEELGDRATDERKRELREFFGIR
jgi:hypothetical protein